MQVLTRPWGQMHTRIDGPKDAPTVVFSNSLGTDYRLWDDVLPLLPAGIRTLRYDKPGHGLSDMAGDYSIDDLADDAAALIQAHSNTPVLFIGLSVGGLIAQAVAARHPSLINGLVLSNTAAKIGTDEMWQTRIDTVAKHGMKAITDSTMQRWFAPSFQQNSQLAQWRNMLERTPASGYIATSKAISRADYTANAPQITVPTLMIAGEHDGATPPALVKATAVLIPNVQYVEIAGAGHLPCAERPADFAAILAPFIQRCLNL
ncbi:3-oxoadipate enol-lactonase [Pseudorhodobacter sp. W20_MBD10_FR17]|uniref:3-oxoadipate enol-lactonase n=1 Tax=Pseudorhodobacter sp. W20_MBD10_FR17 TaxID=3240266 RepID=UPI003F97E777